MTREGGRYVSRPLDVLASFLLFLYWVCSPLRCDLDRQGGDDDGQAGVNREEDGEHQGERRRAAAVDELLTALGDVEGH